MNPLKWNVTKTIAGYLSTAYKTVCSDSEKQKDLTVLIYANAGATEDSVKKYYQHLVNCESPDNVNVVVRFARDGIATDYKLLTRTEAKKVEAAKAENESNLMKNGLVAEKVNMGDKNTLRDFIDKSTQNYPAQQYVLIFDTHGEGYQGLSPDFEKSPDNVDKKEDPLTLNEIKEAFKDSKWNKKMDIICFNACGMGEVEVASQLKDVGKVMIASEEIIWGSLPLFDYMKNNKDKLNNNYQDLAMDFVEKITDTTKVKTVSAVDLTKIGQLEDKIKNFSKEILKISDGKVLDAIKTKIESSQHFYKKFATDYSSGLVDLKDAIEKITQMEELQKDYPDLIKSAENVSASLNEVILKEKHANFSCEHLWGEPDKNGEYVWDTKNNNFVLIKDVAATPDNYNLLNQEENKEVGGDYENATHYRKTFNELIDVKNAHGLSVYLPTELELGSCSQEYQQYTKKLEGKKSYELDFLNNTDWTKVIEHLNTGKKLIENYYGKILNNVEEAI